MATSRTKNPASKKPVRKKPAAKKPAPKPRDLSVDQKSPDAVITVLASHAEGLAGTIRSQLEPLSHAKVTAADANLLDVGAALLRTREEEWQAARKASSTGAVAKCRAPLLTLRNDVYGGIDAFVDDEHAAKELVEIGSVDDDDDLASDASRLVVLARKHPKDLAGTEITPAKIDALAEALAAFRAARKGVKIDAPDGDTKQVLTEAARSALEARNNAFWSLSALDRKISKRGRFCFRADPKRRGDFAAYATEPRRQKKSPPSPATSTPPT